MTEKEMLNSFADAAFQKFNCRDPRVRDAFKSVSRRHFAPDGTPTDQIFSDSTLRIFSKKDKQLISTLSQPSLVAFMVDCLEVQPGDHVLEIGTASGYSAALTSCLNGAPERVASIEYQEELADFAKNNLERAGLSSIQTKTADGFYGWAEKAPFDIITASVGFPYIPVGLISQLKEGGTFVVPIDLDRGGLAPLFIGKKANGKLHGNFWGMPLFFIHLRGDHKVENLFQSVDLDQIKSNHDGSLFTNESLFEDFKMQAGFLLYLTLIRKRIAAVDLKPVLDATDLFFGWVQDEKNYFLSSKGRSIIAGGPEFIEELEETKSKWVELGKPSLDQFDLSLELKPNGYEAWCVWDFEWSVNRK